MATCSSSNDSTLFPLLYHRFRWPHLVCLAAVFFFASFSNAEWVEWIADADLQVNSTQNLNRSGFSSDEEDDNSLRLEGAFGRAYQVNGNLRYTLLTNINVEAYDEFNELDSQSLGISAVFRRKLGTGLTVPWIKGLLKPSYLNVNDDIRSGLNLLAEIQVGKRFSERLDLSGGFRYKYREGKNAPSASPPIGGNVFDQEAWELYVSSGYLLSERWLGSVGIAYMDGEIDSACTTSNVAEVLANETVKGIVADKVFGGCVYRLDAKATTYSLSGSYALGKHDSINIGYQMQSAKTDYQSYKNDIISLSYKYSY